MLDLFVFVLFIAGPFWLGARTRSYWSVVAPAALVIFFISQYGAYESTGDEMDALPLIYMIGSGLGVLVCAAGVAFGRRYRPASEQQH